MATNIGRVTQSIENGAPKQTNAVAKNAPNIQIRQHLANLGEQLVSHSNQNQQEIATLRQRVIVPLPQTAPLQAIQQVINIEEAEPVQEVIVYTWPLEGKHVRLVRLGDKLQSRVTYPNGNIINGLIALPAWLTAENAIIELMEKNPVVDDNNQVRFTKKPEIELLPEPQAEPIGPFNSQLDKEVLIDNDNWAVTLVDSFVNPAWNNPLMWGGHANIFIEKVENGVYSLHKAHLFSVDHNCSSRVELEVIAGFDPTRIASQTVTWVRSKENVQRMLDKVSDEIASQKDGDPSVHFNIRGNDVHSQHSTDWSVHNCYTWARGQLRNAGVFLFKESGTIRPLIVVPKSYISLNTLCAKEDVLIDVYGAGLDVHAQASLYICKASKSVSYEFYQHTMAGWYGKPSMNDSQLTIPITEEIDKLVGGLPWRLVDGELVNEDGEYIDVYHYPYKTLNLDAVRQSQIEVHSPERGCSFPKGKADEMDRFGEVAAIPNLKFLPREDIRYFNRENPEFKWVDTRYMRAKKIHCRVDLPVGKDILREEDIIVEVDRLEFNIHIRNEGIRNIDATEIIKKSIQSHYLRVINDLRRVACRGSSCVIL